jgi:hypothetical protein
MPHPLENVLNRKKNTLFLTLLGLTLAIMLVMNGAGGRLNTVAAPYGIVSFELAGSPQKAQVILDSWDHPAQLQAAFIQGLDYLYLVLYSTTIAQACLWAAKTLGRAGWPLASVGIPLAWGLWLAALSDAVENLALVEILFGSNASPWPEIAAVCAIIKFTLIFLGLVYALYALLIKFVILKKPSATKAS